MADVTTTAGTGAPAAGDTTVTTPAAPAAPAAAAPAVPPQAEDPTWFKPRLEAAKTAAERKVLADLGVTDVAAAKAVLAAAKATADAGKTAEQRASELAASLTTAQTEADRHRAIINEHAARMLGVLTPKQQDLVKGLAGDDPGLQLSTIQKLTDSGVLVIDDDAPPPPPANTAPPPNAPGGSPGTSPPDHQATYAALRTSNPFKAAAYGANNPSVYQPKG